MILFDVNDVFNKFSDEFEKIFGERPNDAMSQEDYDAKVSTLVRTDFYKNLPQESKGFEMLRWARTYGDKQAVFILVNEVKSPTWVNSEKINYVDGACKAMGIPRMDFSIIKELSDLAGHSWRGVFLSRNNRHRHAWDAGNQFGSVYLEEFNDTLMKQLIDAEFKKHG